LVRYIANVAIEVRILEQILDRGVTTHRLLVVGEIRCIARLYARVEVIELLTIGAENLCSELFPVGCVRRDRCFKPRVLLSSDLTLDLVELRVTSINRVVERAPAVIEENVPAEIVLANRALERVALLG
jgi:hypothetical protein